jgi:6-pyruvoyltetrahydropterin/6-carboxytetrahydropterin synthase
MISAERYHDISCGHRVHGHESKCAHLHGHNYRIHFRCRGTARPLDQLGRVLDFSVIKERLCMWVEHNWDHKFLAWEKDDFMQAINSTMIERAFATAGMEPPQKMLEGSLVWVPFNPTAENMADYLLLIAPSLLSGTGVELYEVQIEETRKCSATARRA